jgi:hypothetical protein
VINNAYLIKAINAAFSTPGGLFRVASANPANPNPYRGGSFTTSAKIVVINYENQIPAPPYPPTVDNFYAAAFQLNNDPVFNAPYDLLNSPNVAPDGTILPLNWPNQNYIAWGKPFTPAGGLAAAVATWIGNQVFIIDPNNGNPNLQCFDVTPLFEFSEAYCFYCWDTFDRVTDGKIQGSSSAPPCNPASGCGQTGNGITKWYWTVKFNNIGAAWPLNPNFLIDLYYGPTLLNVGGGPDWWTAFANGAQLNDANKTASASALAFTVNGIATYTWNYKILSTAVTAPMGAMTMSSSGFGYSPMCGVFSGPVSLTEYDRSNPMFNNKVSKASVLCF